MKECLKLTRMCGNCVNNGTVLCLGFFDSLHKGHISVIEKAKEIANKFNLSVTIFSFNGNLKKALFGKDEKVVLLSSERKKIIKRLGDYNAFFMPVNKRNLSLSKKQFLDYLSNKFCVKYFVSGKDFRFGKNAEGNVDYLNEYGTKNGIKTITVDTFMIGNEKVSTTKIKNLLSNGQIKQANSLLCRDFFISGKVVLDRGEGTKMGYPTVNLNFSLDKAVLKKGVYFGYAKIGKKTFKALINYGTRPTFNQSKLSLEAHLLDFSGDLYGKNITIIFKDFIREEKKFSSKEELIAQIKIDEAWVRAND